MKIELMLIDPQESFCDSKGSLFVPGADADMDRIATLIGDLTPKLDRIHVTLDQHHAFDISHPAFFVSEHGDPAKPITIMSYDSSRDVFVGFCPIDNTTTEYRTRLRSLHNHTREYIDALATSGRYGHTIWPEHCLIGTSGSTVVDPVMSALNHWARTRARTVNFVAKGSSPLTEHFSAVRAEVPQAKDPSTQLNTGLIDVLEQADVILFAGEALSHCVANTGRDIVDAFGNAEYVKKIHLLEDCSSSVTGFETLGDEFLKDMRALGMKTLSAKEALKLFL